MRAYFCQAMIEAIQQAAIDAKARTGTVNVPVLAERIRYRFEHDNIALEDVERALMNAAFAHQVACEFDGRSDGLVPAATLVDAPDERAA